MTLGREMTGAAFVAWLWAGRTAGLAGTVALQTAEVTMTAEALASEVAATAAALPAFLAGRVVGLRFPRADPAALVACMALWTRDATPLLLDAAGNPSVALGALGAAQAVAVVRSESVAALDPDLPTKESGAGTCVDHLPGRQQTGPAGRPTGYLVATSGSTGTPRICANSLRSLQNTVEGLISRFGLGRDSRMFQFAPCNYDAFLADVLPTLRAGGVLSYGRAGGWSGWLQLTDDVRVARPTHMGAPPAVWRRILPMDHRLKVGISAGEALDLPTAALLAEGADRVVNAYGPAEATICTTTWTYTPAAEGISLGSPLPGVSLAVLSDDGVVLPTGEGALRIYGTGVGEGYLRPEPSQSGTWFGTETDGRAFVQTADRVTLSAERTAFLGRTDRTVKRHGRLVNLDHVEDGVRALAPVGECTVVWDGTDMVCEYTPLVPAPRVASLAEAVLESWELPSRWREVEDLALGASDKLDRRTSGPAHGLSSSAPQDSPARQTLAHLWAVATGGGSLTVPFFTAGGDSLAAMTLLDQIGDRFSVDVDIVDFLRNPTFDMLASLSDPASAES